ncbi:hypothetical protein RN001_000978 [Aquatica leii]|uniref:C2H2-type domain-containing protein n=1 Tax=Aquatica leii TaxID=1421715 RepID=A0AAN7Q7K5_9COLE|nr:hypothetical protein RN001_000978 [Aquatica leii]
MLIENSDGNLEINTIRTFEEHRDDEAEEIPVEQDNDEINDEFIEDDSLIDLMSNNAPEEGMSEEDEPLTEDDYNNDPTYFDKPEELAVQKVEESNPCTLCDREFKTAATLKRHVIVCHAVEEEQDDPLTFQLCLCCGEPVDSAHTFGDFKCLLCEKLFFTQTSLERHKKSSSASEDDKEINTARTEIKRRRGVKPRRFDDYVMEVVAGTPPIQDGRMQGVNRYAIDGVGDVGTSAMELQKRDAE